MSFKEILEKKKVGKKQITIIPNNKKLSIVIM